MGTASSDRHVVFSSLVPFLEQDQVLSRYQRSVVQPDKANGALRLKSPDTTEVLRAVRMELALPVPKYDLSEELREGRRLEGHGAVRLDKGPIGALEQRTGDVTHTTTTALSRGYLAGPREVTSSLGGRPCDREDKGQQDSSPKMDPTEDQNRMAPPRVRALRTSTRSKLRSASNPVPSMILSPSYITVAESLEIASWSGTYLNSALSIRRPSA